MSIEFTDQERQTLRKALESYLSNLREEIVKTEKHEWRQQLHAEESTLKDILKRLG